MYILFPLGAARFNSEIFHSNTLSAFDIKLYSGVEHSGASALRESYSRTCTTIGLNNTWTVGSDNQGQIKISNPQGPVVQSIVSLTTSLRRHFVKYMPTTLSNLLLFFVEKM